MAQRGCSLRFLAFNAHTGKCSAIPPLTTDSNLKVDRIYAGSIPGEWRDGYSR
jgi:hypothetical protein